MTSSAGPSPVISHITLGANDMVAAETFYDAVLPVLGFLRLEKPAGKPPAYAKPLLNEQGEFSGEYQLPYVYVYTPFDDQPATVGNGSHIAFLASSAEQVEAFHAAALSHGGSDEGAPGIREVYSSNYFAAYVRDPEGNKLQAVCYL